MKNLLWRAFAAVVCWPPIVDTLLRLAMKRPYVHIGDYMRRYWLIPYSWHLPIAVRIHHIKRADAEPFLHDHPYSYRTVILRGFYIEEDVFGMTRLRRAGSTSGASAETFHRISAVTSFGGAWTLFVFFTWRRKNRWGFMVGSPPRKVYWRTFEALQSANDNDGTSTRTERQA